MQRFKGCCLIVAAVTYLTITLVGREGFNAVALLIVLVSPVAMLFIRVFLEPYGPAGLLNLRRQCWSFLIGDLLVLPFVVAMLISSYREIDAHWIKGDGLLIGAYIVGLCIGYFYRRSEIEAYTRSRNYYRLNSPTKLWHDLVVYPSVAGSLVFFALPVYITAFDSGLQATSVLALVGFIVWIALCIIDAFRKVSPAALHPNAHETLLT